MPNSCKATVSMAEDPGLHIRSPGTRPGSASMVDRCSGQRGFQPIGWRDCFMNARSSSAPDNIGDFSLRMHIVSEVICNHSRGIFGEGFIVVLPTNSQINPQNR
jgi:hypothetical protein